VRLSIWLRERLKARAACACDGALRTSRNKAKRTHNPTVWYSPTQHARALALTHRFTHSHTHQIATDDEEIAREVQAAVGDVIMTPAHCASGTARVSSAARRLPYVMYKRRYKIYVLCIFCGMYLGQIRKKKFHEKCEISYVSCLPAKCPCV
jgi:hypothetical protein